MVYMASFKFYPYLKTTFKKKARSGNVFLKQSFWRLGFLSTKTHPIFIKLSVYIKKGMTNLMECGHFLTFIHKFLVLSVSKLQVLFL